MARDDDDDDDYDDENFIFIITIRKFDTKSQNISIERLDFIVSLIKK